MWSFCQSSSNGERGAGELLRILLCVARILALSLCVGLLVGGSNRAHSSQMGVTQGVATAANESVLDVSPKFNHHNPGASPVGIGGCVPAPTVPITWSSPVNVSNNAGVSLSPAVAVDTTGTLHAVWYDNSISGNLDILYARKEPDQSWSAPVRIANTPGDSYWPAIAIDTADNVHVAWEDGGTGRDILCAMKPAGSVAWTSPVTLSNSPGTARFVALVADGVGNVHAVWNDDTPGNAEIYYAMRPQGAITWTTPAIVASTPGTSWAPTIAADVTGTLHVAWHDFTPGVTEIYYATKPGPAGPWSSPIDVSRTTGASYFPALAVDSSGTVHLVWQDTIVTGVTIPFEILYAQKRPGEGWTAYVSLSRGSGSAEMPTLAVGPKDALHVAWDTTGDPRLLYVRRPAPEMGWTALVTVTAVSPGTQYPAPALAADMFDAVHLLWSDVGPLGRDIFHSTAAPPPIPEDHVLVLDEEGFAVAGACIYQNGIPTIATDDAGISVPPALTVGDALVALQAVTQSLTIREVHATPDSDGAKWAYRTCLTDMTVTPEGIQRTHVVTHTGQQRLVIKKSSSLVLFNLVVSIEWDATVTYTQEISRAVQYASNYLYDMTDGQMAFGQVAIYDNGNYWADADVQISTQNIVRPHAYVGGITSDDTSHVIRLGRGWNGRSGNQGPWDQPDGFHTLGHEFGHYALHLYDEYFAYTFDPNGNLTGEVPAYCTGPENRNPASAATNASVMDYQYTTSELSARGVPGLWSPLCEQTAQWQLTERQLGRGESPWETLTRMYTDTLSPPRWQFITPLERGHVMTGPTGMLTNVLGLPTITISNTGASGPPRQLTVYGPTGEPHWGALVALYKRGGRVVGQGFTDGNGRLDVYGADEGDRLQAASMNGGLAGSVTVTTGMSLTLTMRPVQGLAAQVAGGIPHMRVVAEPSLDPSQIDLLVFLQGFGLGATPSVTVTRPGGEVGYDLALSYSPGTDTYGGEISFSATERGTGRIRAVGAAGGGLVRLQSTYRLQRVLNDQYGDIYSDDGNLSLHLEPGSLLGDEAYLVVMPPGALPGPLPEGLVLVGDPYDVTGSGAMVMLEKPAVLKLHYDGALVTSVSAPAGLGIYRWDPTSETWQAVTGSVDEGQRVMVAPVTVLGTYALLGPDSIVPPPGQKTFLPIILNGASTFLYDTASFLVREGVSGFIRVVDAGDNPVASATVYADGQPIGATGQDGLLDPGSLEIGTALVALAQQAEQPASRNAHDGWAYRTFLGSLTLDTEGDPQPFIVSGPGEQRLVVRPDSPLILFNLLVSIEWDADVTYTEEISRAIRSASDYLYDITDAQMAFGQAAIYDDAEHWTDADMHISVRNIVRPHAHVGGINSADPAHAIKLGRSWDGSSGNQGPWDRPDGYRTLIHQFGHYALYLYDEYFGYVFDQDGNRVGEVPAYCTGPENRNPATDATNASVMDYQYTTSELSARDVPGLWSPLCEQTVQWQMNGESAWETVTRTYSDTISPPRWQFTTPIERGSVLTGPTSLPPGILALPQVEVHQTGTSPPVRQLTVYGPYGEAYGGANVSLHKQDGQIIEQGLTDRNGQLDIYGATEGDTIQAVSSDAGLRGSITVGTATSLTLVLEPQYKIYLPVAVRNWSTQ